MNFLFDAEIALHMAPFIALGAAAIAYKIKWYRDEKRVQRENHRAYMAAAIAAKEREQEYKCRVLMFRTWDEINHSGKKTERCDLKGCMAEQVSGMSEGELAAVFSGRYAAAEKIRRVK